MIYFQTPLGDVDFYANGGEVQPNCHPIYDPQCSIGAAYKLLTHHYNVSMKIFSKLIIKIEVKHYHCYLKHFTNRYT